ncbi:MAG: hypothetical protein U5P10_09225, partial [Spirochaetia bacterium]|nr:hypothetical protein [Spirochaetia bacterium]
MRLRGCKMVSVVSNGYGSNRMSLHQTSGFPLPELAEKIVRALVWSPLRASVPPRVLVGENSSKIRSFSLPLLPTAKPARNHGYGSEDNA